MQLRGIIEITFDAFDISYVFISILVTGRGWVNWRDGYISAKVATVPAPVIFSAIVSCLKKDKEIK